MKRRIVDRLAAVLAIALAGAVAAAGEGTMSGRDDHERSAMRVEELETRVAFQEHTLSELNDVVSAQSRELLALRPAVTGQAAL